MVNSASLTQAPFVDQGTELCADLAEGKAAEAGLSGEPYNFACVADKVVVEDSTEAATEESRKEALPAAVASSESLSKLQTGEETSALSGTDSAAVAANSCSTGVYTRTIVSPLQEDIGACLVYGQKGHPINGNWVNSQNVTLSIFPAIKQHKVKYKSYSTNAPSTSEWYLGMTLKKNNGIFLPKNWGVAWDAHVPVNTLTPRSINVSPGTSKNDDLAGTWHVNFHFSVSNHQKNFYMDIDKDVNTHRFTCAKNSSGVVQQCRWPNGKEAPV